MSTSSLSVTLGRRQGTALVGARLPREPSTNHPFAHGAHDVLSDRRRSPDRRGWAVQSNHRSWETINQPGHARLERLLRDSRVPLWLSPAHAETGCRGP